MKAFIIHTKRTPLMWLERIYPTVGGYTVREFKGSLVYLEGLRDNHNGFHKDKFTYNA